MNPYTFDKVARILATVMLGAVTLMACVGAVAALWVFANAMTGAPL